MQAVNRGDKIRATANPSIASNIIYENPTGLTFNNFQEVVNYMQSFDSTSINFTRLGYFGREVHTLVNNGYNFNQFTNLFEL